MNEKPTNKRVWPAVMLALLLVLSMYPLSIGPVARLTQRGTIPEPVGGAVFMPLLLLADRSPPVGRAMSWYINLWIGKSQQPVR